MSTASTDRNLLFGVLALQMDFVSRDALVAAMHAWVADKDKPLGQILVETAALSHEHRALLEPLVDAHIARHGHDVSASLAAVSTHGAARDALASVHDADVQRSLGHVSLHLTPDDDPLRTAVDVGSPVVAGERYRILRPHAEGGLGRVSVAFDEELSRQVALKEIKDQHAQHPDHRARFVLEAEITGGLEHPGIVPIYSLGRYQDGRPFYAMRFIKGDSLLHAIGQFHAPHGAGQGAEHRNLELRKLLARFIDVCHAIEYAHSRGVLHRDLKPGNIMLGKFSETLVVDWGLAKPLGRADTPTPADESLLTPSSASGSTPTQMGAAVGTPAYMSPEQALGQLDVLGPASDVYSLGATLYHLLAGRPPFSAANVADTMRKVKRGEFARPRAVRSDIPAPLEAICLRAMHLEPSRRYASAALLAEDVEHWLADEPVAAQPDTLPQRLGRLARRHRAWTQAAAAMLVVVAVGSAIAAVLVNQQRRLVDQQRRRAEVQSAQLAFEQSYARCLQDDAGVGLLHLARALVQAEAAGADDVAAALRRQLAGWTRYVHHLESVVPHPLRAGGVAISADGRTALVANESSAARILDLTTGSARGAPLAHQGEVMALALSADGRLALTGSKDKTARLWELDTGQPRGAPLPHEATVTTVAFDATSRRFATGDAEGKVRFWSLETHQPIGATLQHHAEVCSLAFSHDGGLLLVGSADGRARLWDIERGELVAPPIEHRGRVAAVALSKNLSLAVTASWDRSVRVWRFGPAYVYTSSVPQPIGEPAPPLPAVDEPAASSPSGRRYHLTPYGSPLVHQGEVLCVDLSADDQWLLTGSNDGAARLWNLATAETLGPPLRHEDAVLGVKFSGDGRTLQSVGGTSTRQWRRSDGGLVGPPWRQEWGVVNVALAEQGDVGFAATLDGAAQLWHVATGEPAGPLVPERVVPAPVPAPAAARGPSPAVVRAAPRAPWRLAYYQPPVGSAPPPPMAAPPAALPPPAVLQPVPPVPNIAVPGGIVPALQIQAPQAAPPETWLAMRPQFAERRDADGHLLPAEKSARRVLTFDNEAVDVWDADTGQRLGKPLKLDAGDSVTTAIFSPDATTVVTAHDLIRGQIHQWNAATGARLAVGFEHGDEVTALAVSPDGRVLASASFHGTLRLWERASGKPLPEPVPHDGRVYGCAFSRDGSRLLSWGDDKTARMWNVTEARAFAPPLVHPDAVLAAVFAPEGDRLFTACHDRSVRCWDARTGRAIGPPLPHDGPVFDLAVNRAGTLLLTASADGTARLWDVAVGKMFGPPLRHEGSVRAVAWSRTGRTVASASDDGTARAWHVAAPVDYAASALVVIAERTTGMLLDPQGSPRALTAAEWRVREDTSAASSE